MYKNTICKLGKTQSELKLLCLLLIFKVVYRDHLTQLLPFAKGFRSKRAAAGLGPSELMQHHVQ